MGLPVQFTPLASSENPLKQPHTKDPSVLVQFCSQLSVPSVHSSMSEGIHIQESKYFTCSCGGIHIIV